MSQLKVATYASLPRFGVRSGIALGVALGAAMPSDAPEMVKTAAAKIGSKVVRLQNDWATQQSLSPTDARPADARVDRAWRGVHHILDGLRNFRPAARAQSAQWFFELLFPTGLAFTKLPYREQWAECGQRLERLNHAAVAQEFNDTVGGPECLAELHAAHEAYGRALDITDVTNARRGQGVASALRELKDAIADYTVNVLAWSRVSAQSEQAACNALRPIDLLRAAARNKLPPDVDSS